MRWLISLHMVHTGHTGSAQFKNIRQLVGISWGLIFALKMACVIFIIIYISLEPPAHICCSFVY